jgi:hypothetical protein
LTRMAGLIASLVVGMVACGGGNSSGGGNGGSGNGGGSAGASAGGSCETECDRQVAAGCPKTPPDFGNSCKAICGGMRQSLPPSCVQKFDALYSCAAAKVTYTCTSSGVVQITPIGACAAEGAACIACSSSCFPGA